MHLGRPAFNKLTKYRDVGHVIPVCLSDDIERLSRQPSRGFVLNPTSIISLNCDMYVILPEVSITKSCYVHQQITDGQYIRALLGIIVNIPQPFQIIDLLFLF